MTSREKWPLRRYRLGEEPGDDLSLSTTAEERLEMVETLSNEARTFTGRPFPSYARHETLAALVQSGARNADRVFAALERNKRASGRTKDLADLEALGER